MKIDVKLLSTYILTLSFMVALTIVATMFVIVVFSGLNYIIPVSIDSLTGGIVASALYLIYFCLDIGLLMKDKCSPTCLVLIPFLILYEVISETDFKFNLIKIEYTIITILKGKIVPFSNRISKNIIY